MNSELTAQNSRLRTRVQHISQLVPIPAARNKRHHASTDVAGTNKTVRLPTTLGRH